LGLSYLGRDEVVEDPGGKDIRDDELKGLA
jgi:hypothetical protein